MGWVGVTHVRRHHAHYHTSGGGHLYQGRFKSFPVQDDRHLLIVGRYIEANALRAGLVRRAEEWPFGALAARCERSICGRAQRPPMVKWPVDRPRNWLAIVNEPMEDENMIDLRRSVMRDRPFGADSWVQSTAKRLCLKYTLRERGRPRRQKE